MLNSGRSLPNVKADPNLCFLLSHGRWDLLDVKAPLEPRLSHPLGKKFLFKSSVKFQRGLFMLVVEFFIQPNCGKQEFVPRLAMKPNDLHHLVFMGEV